jgi:hypothetical protein
MLDGKYDGRTMPCGARDVIHAGEARALDTILSSFFKLRFRLSRSLLSRALSGVLRILVDL